MGLWGTDADATDNKPKNLTADTNSDYAKKDVFANKSGWVRRAGTAANGNDNADAQEEVLVAIGDLSGASSTTGLKAPTISSTCTQSRVCLPSPKMKTGLCSFIRS